LEPGIRVRSVSSICVVPRVSLLKLEVNLNNSITVGATMS